MEERVVAENPEDEIVLGESVSEEARRIRVYGPSNEEWNGNRQAELVVGDEDSDIPF